MNTKRTVAKGSHEQTSIPKHMVKAYVSNMLTELATMAKDADLNRLSSLLRATESAACVDIKNLD